MRQLCDNYAKTVRKTMYASWAWTLGAFFGTGYRLCTVSTANVGLFGNKVCSFR